MLRQISRQGRMDAMLNDNDDTSALASILQSRKSQIGQNNNKKDENTTGSIHLTTDEYCALLQYLQASGQPYHPAHEFPHPDNALILPPYVQKPLQLHRDHCTFSCKKSHKGNSGIKFYNPSTQSQDTGFIEAI